MLKLHHNYHLPVPHFTHSMHKLELSPVQSESDELIMAIETAHADDNWTLENTPDVAGLDDFWTHVEEDLKKDPGWFSFTED